MTLNQLGHRAYAVGFALLAIGVLTTFATLLVSGDRPHMVGPLLVGVGVVICFTVGVVAMVRDAWKVK